MWRPGRGFAVPDPRPKLESGGYPMGCRHFLMGCAYSGDFRLRHIFRVFNGLSPQKNKMGDFRKIV